MIPCCTFKIHPTITLLTINSREAPQNITSNSFMQHLFIRRSNKFYVTMVWQGLGHYMVHITIIYDRRSLSLSRQRQERPWLFFHGHLIYWAFQMSGSTGCRYNAADRSLAEAHGSHIVNNHYIIRLMWSTVLRTMPSYLATAALSNDLWPMMPLKCNAWPDHPYTKLYMCSKQTAALLNHKRTRFYLTSDNQLKMEKQGILYWFYLIIYCFIYFSEKKI